MNQSALRFGPKASIGQISNRNTEIADAGSEPIGHIDSAEDEVFVTRIDGTKIVADSGTPIFLGDIVETGEKGSVGMIFADDSTFALADSGKMTIDQMVYDPAEQAGKSAFDIAAGVFTFVSGHIAKGSVDDMTITTPVATIGVRGTSGGGKIVNPQLNDPDAVSPPSGIFSNFNDPVTGQPGEFTISTATGSQTLNSVNATSRVPSPFVPPSQPVQLPEAAVKAFFQSAQATMPRSPAQPPESDADDGSITAQDDSLENETADQEGETEGGDTTESENQITEEASEEQALALSAEELGDLELGEAGAADLEQGDGIPGLSDGTIDGEPIITTGLPQKGATTPQQLIADEAAAEAFSQVLAEGGNLDAAFDAAAVVAGEAATRFGMEAGKMDMFTPATIVNDIIASTVDNAMGGLGGFGPPSPVSAGQGSSAAYNSEIDRAQEFIENIIQESADVFAEEAAAAMSDIVGGYMASGLIDVAAAGEMMSGFNLVSEDSQKNIESTGFGDDVDDGPIGIGTMGIGPINISVIGYGIDSFLGYGFDVFFEEELEFVAEDTLDEFRQEDRLLDTDYPVTINGTVTVALNYYANDLVTGSTDDDMITLSGAAQSGDVFDGISGTDTLILDNFPNTLVAKNIDTIKLPDTDSIQTLAFETSGSLTLTNEDASSTNPTAPFNFSGEGLSDDELDQTLTLTFEMNGNIANNSRITMSGGTDTVILQNGTNKLSDFAGIENFTLGGGSMTNTFTLEKVLAGQTVNGSDAEGGDSGNDHISVGGLSTSDTIAAGSGTDKLIITDLGSTTLIDADFTNVSGFESLDLGSDAAYNLTLGSNFKTAFGSSSVTLTGTGVSTNNITISSSRISIDVNADFSNTSGVVKITTGSGADELTGGSGADTLTGSGGVDILVGGDGDDFLKGNAAADTLTGGAGNDKFWGGLANDNITGGEGTDTYQFRPISSGGSHTNGVDNLSYESSSYFSTDIFDFKTSGIAGIGSSEETILRQTISDLSNPDNQGILIFTDDATGTASDLETSLNSTTLDTMSGLNDRVIVWEINSTTAGVGIVSNSDSNDNDDVAINQVAQITGLADQSAVDSFTTELSAANFDII